MFSVQLQFVGSKSLLLPKCSQSPTSNACIPRGAKRLAPLNWLTWHHSHSDTESHQNFHSLLILEYSKDKNHVSIVLFGAMILEPKCTFNGLTRVPMARWAHQLEGVEFQRRKGVPAMTSHKPRCNSGFFRLCFDIEKVTFVAKSNQTLLQASDFSLCCQDLMWFPPRVYNSGSPESQVYDN